MLRCTNLDGLGRLQVSAVATTLRSTAGRETRVEGCAFQGAGPMDITAGKVLLRNHFGSAIRLSAGELTLESTSSEPVVQAGPAGPQHDAQNTGSRVSVLGGALTMRHVLVNRLDRAAGTVTTQNCGALGGVEVLGGAFTYRGGFIGEGTGNVYVAEAATASPLAVGIAFRGGAPGVTHLLDDVEVIARRSVVIEPAVGRLSVAIQDSGLSGLDPNGAFTILATDADVRADRSVINNVNGQAMFLWRSHLTLRDSRLLCGGGNASTVQEDQGAEVVGNIFRQCSETIVVNQRPVPSAPFNILGNTFAGGFCGVLSGGSERIEHNLFDVLISVYPFESLQDGTDQPELRWNHMVTQAASLNLGFYPDPVGWVGNTLSRSAFLDALARPTPASPCVLVRSTATALDMPRLATFPLDRSGAARTLPYTKGAVEFDGACGCLTNERVSSGVCVPCASGATNAAGDNADGPDTVCEGTLCGANQRVASNACVACAAGTTNAAGDNAVGADTACDATLCAVDQRVANHACVACAPGTRNAAADSAAGGDTQCDVILCGVGERVANHMCVACGPGLTSGNGHDASGNDTPCYAASSDTVNVVASGASAYWPLNEPMGPVAWDIIKPLPATVIGGVAFGQTGMRQTAVALDGTGTLEAPYDVASNPAGSFSVEFWMEPSGRSNDFQSLVTSRDAPAKGYVFYVTPANSAAPNQLQFWLGNGTTWMTVAGPTVQVGGRYHVVGSYNAATAAMVLYVNGVAVGSRGAAGFVRNTTRPLRLGAGTTEGIPGLFFKGMLDEVVIYPRALFPADATVRYAYAAAPLCLANQRVANHACVPCPPGHINAAGDDPNLTATVCDVWVCALNERVAGNTCVACAASSVNEPGDVATGADTQCYSACGANQRVVNSLCLPCPAGTTNAPGDLVTAVNTACDPTLCPANQFVSGNTCQPCAAGSTNAAGDDASGGDTQCDTTLCTVNRAVLNHVCTPCSLGERRLAGDPATGPDTLCYAQFCSADERVVSNACVACGGCSGVGGMLTGGNTTCAPTPGLPYGEAVRADSGRWHWPLNEVVPPLKDVIDPREAVINGEVTLGAPGQVGTAVSMAGNGSITLPQSLFNSLGFTVEMWVAPNANAEGTDQVLVDGMSLNPFNNLYPYGYRLLLMDRGQINFITARGQYSGAEFVGLVSPPLERGRWHHVVATVTMVLTNTVPYFSFAKAVYVNGVLVASGDVDRVENAFPPPVVLGGPGRSLWNMRNVHGYQGAMDEFALYSYPLDAAAVRRHFITGRRGATYPAASCGAPCAANQRVQSHACQTCVPGSTNAAGNDPAGSDTQCAPTLCGVNQRVSNHVCMACPVATTSAAGADASGNDTTCAPVLCELDQRVSNRACVPCEPGLRRPPGDDATGPDTACSAVMGTYASRVTGAGALAYWPLNESAGPVMDVVAGLTAVDVGTVQFGQPGLVQPTTALAFEAGDHVEVPYNTAHNPAGSFSVEFWMMRTADSANHQSPVTLRNNGLTGYTFYVAPSTSSKPNQLEFWLGNGSTWKVVQGPPASLNVRYHVVGTYSAATGVMTLYVNGTAMGSTPVSAVPNTAAPLRVGAGATEGPATFFFNGVVDELAVYGSALSALEIAYHHVLGATQQ